MTRPLASVIYPCIQASYREENIFATVEDWYNRVVDLVINASKNLEINMERMEQFKKDLHQQITKNDKNDQQKFSNQNPEYKYDLRDIVYKIIDLEEYVKNALVSGTEVDLSTLLKPVKCCVVAFDNTNNFALLNATAQSTTIKAINYNNLPLWNRPVSKGYHLIVLDKCNMSKVNEAFIHPEDTLVKTEEEWYQIMQPEMVKMVKKLEVITAQMNDAIQNYAKKG